MFNFLEGYKTYGVALAGMLTSEVGLLNHQVSPTQEVFNIIALLIVMALRSAMKTETGKLSSQVVQGILTAAPASDTVTPPSTVSEKKVDAALAALKEALLGVPPTP